MRERDKDNVCVFVRERVCVFVCKRERERDIEERSKYCDLDKRDENICGVTRLKHI